LIDLKLPEIKDLVKLRKSLHKNPEQAFDEYKTSQFLKNFINSYNPTEVINLGNTGLAFVFEGQKKGATVLVRADMDALPIPEENYFAHKSQNEGMSHKCGHDGHMTIAAGLAMLINKNRNFRGKIILLFQPAEETGEGAKKILTNSKFKKLKPDYVLALHNLPGFKKHEIVYKKDYFASASTGLILKLKGKTSHAAEPEKGNSPVNAMVEIIAELNKFVATLENELKDFALLTVVHTRLGERAFGTTPGYAEIMVTLRSYRNDDMKLLKRKSIALSRNIAGQYGLSLTHEWTETFPATFNDPALVDTLLKVIKKNKLIGRQIEHPFRWSEDFGYFTEKYRGILFGLGAGKNTPQLHNPDYDFPDEIIKTGVAVFYSLITELQKNHT
jgi:amidohydrolase